MDIISTTLLKANNMFNLDYIDLSKDEKQRFDNKYTLIHERMPFIRSLSTDINKTINKGLINLIKNNRECFINQIYIDYVENLICNVSGIKFRDRKRSYRNSFILSKDITEASTAIPIPNSIAAIPGRVNVPSIK